MLDLLISLFTDAVFPFVLVWFGLSIEFLTKFYWLLYAFKYISLDILFYTGIYNIFVQLAAIVVFVSNDIGRDILNIFSVIFYMDFARLSFFDKILSLALEVSLVVSSLFTNSVTQWLLRRLVREMIWLIAALTLATLAESSIACGITYIILLIYYFGGDPIRWLLSALIAFDFARLSFFDSVLSAALSIGVMVISVITNIVMSGFVDSGVFALIVLYIYSTLSVIFLFIGDSAVGVISLLTVLYSVMSGASVSISSKFLLLLLVFLLLVILVIIRGGAPRYRIEQLSKFNFSIILPSTVLFITVIIILIFII